MSRRAHDPSRLLRWYPPAWRDRYGDEFTALMEDTAEASGVPTRHDRWSVVRAGLRERTLATGLLGDSRPPAERLRAGALLVLCAWSLFVLGGISLQRLSEHFGGALWIGSSALPFDAMDLIEALATVAAVVVAFGAAVALPAFVTFLGDGGWRAVRRPFWRAVALSAVGLAATAAVSLWAHHLSVAQRNGADAVYSWSIVCFALLVTAIVAQWTATAVAAARRITLGARALHTEAVLAVVLALTMAAMTAATAVWWGAMAHSASWFLPGRARGHAASPVTSNLVVTMAIMVTATGAAAFGVTRIGRSWRTA
jgi:hypothetical protein